MDIKTLKKKLQKDPFTEEIVEAIVRSNDYDIMICALKRNDCPSSLIADLFMALNENVRLLCASHPNAPILALRKMIEKDKNKDVRTEAKKNLSMRK